MTAQEASVLAEKNELNELMNKIGLAVGRGVTCALVGNITFKQNEEKLKEWGYRIYRTKVFCDSWGCIGGETCIEWPNPPTTDNF